MIILFGKNKTEAKIASGNLRHRPDADAGLDGEWDREYQVDITQKITLESDKLTNKIVAETELKDEADRKDAFDRFANVQHCLAFHASGDSYVASASGGGSGSGNGTGSGASGSVDTVVQIKREGEKTAGEHGHE